MKRMKNALMAICAILMGTTFTSCLNSENGSSWDIADYATLHDIYGSKVYKLDNTGYTITVTNGNTMFGGADKWEERTFLYLKLAEDEVITEGKTNYTASIVASEGILVKDFCNRPDTLLEKSAPFIAIADGGWTSNGQSKDYLNMKFTTTITEKTQYQYFNLIPEESDGKTLYVKLHQNENIENVYTMDVDLFLNFRLPYAEELKEVLGEEEYKKLTFFGSSNDSINIVLRAINSSNSVIEAKPIKAKIYGADY